MMQQHGPHDHTDHQPAGHGGHVDGKHPEADTHGMLIVGAETLFLSHFPMFNHPHHDFQVILEVMMRKPGQDPQQAYVQDRKASGQKMYTFVPEEFFLPEIAPTGPSSMPSPSFSGTVVRGHFERSGTPILRDVTVDIAQVVHFRQFDPQAGPLEHLEYLFFGKGEERFLAHLITKPPDFDQILSAQVTGHALSDEDLSQGLRVVIPSRANTAPDRIKEGQEVTGDLHLPGQGAPAVVTIQIAENTEFYFEEGELGERFSMKQTPEEKAAGF
jgi:hypothetical protein